MLAVIANEFQRKELEGKGIADDQQVVWMELPESNPDVRIYMDLLFDNSPQRIELLSSFPADCVIINHVAGTLKNLPENFVRFNGWPTFLQRELAECVISQAGLNTITEEAFSIFKKKICNTPDVPGFISARTIALIINEAYMALEEGVSSKEETDIAMKMGTNYPWGPFEWAEKIGLNNIYVLLKEMALVNKRYTPAKLITEEATNA
jgi:3-hydroxybutyryl-CoA dehydrogenase